MPVHAYPCKHVHASGLHVVCLATPNDYNNIMTIVPLMVSTKPWVDDAAIDATKIMPSTSIALIPWPLLLQPPLLLLQLAIVCVMALGLVVVAAAAKMVVWRSCCGSEGLEGWTWMPSWAILGPPWDHHGAS